MTNKWITFDNRIIKMNEMSHQHMSNIHHYITIIVPSIYNLNTRNYIDQWLMKRFNGVILDYQPHRQFKEEFNYLNHKGYIKPDGSIVVNGKRIGSICLN